MRGGPAGAKAAKRDAAKPTASARTRASGKPQAGAKRPRGGVRVRIVRLPHADGLPMPAYQTEGAAGLDLVAAVDAKKPVRLPKGRHALIPTGLILELPLGTEAQVRPRSGLAMKHGVTVLNAPGTIDCDYRGEVQVLLVNHGPKPFVVQRGERIAQLVIAPVARADLVEATAVTVTARGAGGFGSTGLTQAGADAVKPRGARKSNSVPSAPPAGKRQAPAKRKPTVRAR